MENPIGTVAWTRLTQDMILPAFNVTLSGGFTADVGQTVTTPAFTASYTSPPVTAVLTDNAGDPPTDVIGSPNNFMSPFTGSRSTPGQSVTFTLTASPSAGSPDSASTTITWLNRSYFGVAAPGQTGAPFILTLSSHFEASRADFFSVNAGPAQKIYYASRTAFGPATFTINGFTGGFTLVQAAVPVTNAFSVVENYDLYESNNVGLGLTSVTVS